MHGILQYSIDFYIKWFYKIKSNLNLLLSEYLNFAKTLYYVIFVGIIISPLISRYFTCKILLYVVKYVFFLISSI